MMVMKYGSEPGFARFHPMVNLIFFTFVISIAMFSTNYVFVGVTLIFSWVYSVMLRGRKAVRFNIIIMLPLIVVMTLVNGFFVHNGATVLFYINDNRITTEAFIFGAVSAVLLTGVIVWFSCFNVIITSEKLIYIFGRVAPVLGLTVSMIFRFIPLLKDRFREITMGQRCMGRDFGSGSLLQRARQLMKEVSILVSWSLEASIETADSMEARGYGLKGRTSFHLFKFGRSDGVALAYILIFGGLAAAGCIMGATKMYYYPEILTPDINITAVITMVSYCMLMAFPAVLEIAEGLKCAKLNFEM